MSRWCLIYRIIFLLLLVLPCSRAGAADFDEQGLTAFVKQTISNLKPKQATLAVTVADARSGEVLFDVNGRAQLTPASVQKIITSISALKLLGPSYRFSTDVFVDRVVFPGDSQSVNDLRPGHVGDIYLRGSGDPSLVNEQLKELAEAVKRLGVTHVRDVVVDDSAFVNPDRASGERPFNAALSAVSLNHNCFAIEVVPTQVGQPALVSLIPEVGFSFVNRVITVAGEGKGVGLSLLGEKAAYRNENGELFDENLSAVQAVIPRVVVRGDIGVSDSPEVIYRTVENPAAYAGAVFKGFLEKAGVEVSGISRSGLVKKASVPLTKLLSKDLATILKDLNLYSNNFIAGQLFFALGQGSDGRFRRENSQKRIYEVLSSADLGPKDLTIVDGSGLDRENRLSTWALVRILSYGFREFSVESPLVSSLSRFGESGTLKDRSLVKTSAKDSDVRNDRKKNSEQREDEDTSPKETNELGLIEYGKYAQNDVWAKTGTLDGVSSIAGFAASRYGRPMSFAIIINGPIDKNSASAIENEIVRQLIGLN